mgnify:CR=1 FL=1
MSINIHFEAVREVTVNRTGKIESQTEYFNAWQTPTTVSYEIVKSADYIKAYKDWVLSIAKDEQVNVYADDDIFGDGDPISVEIVNEGCDHIAELDQWMDSVKDRGFNVEVTIW